MDKKYEIKSICARRLKLFSTTYEIITLSLILISPFFLFVFFYLIYNPFDSVHIYKTPLDAFAYVIYTHIHIYIYISIYTLTYI